MTNPTTNMGSAIYYKIASGSEGSSQTWSGFSMSSSFYNVRAQMLAFTGCDSTTPIVTSGTPQWAVTSNTNTTAAQTHPSETPTTAGSGVLLFRTQYETGGTNHTFTSSITSAGTPAGVERSDPSGTNDADIAIYTRDGGFSLAAQSYTTTASGTGSGGNHMWTVILNAAAVTNQTITVNQTSETDASLAKAAIIKKKSTGIITETDSSFSDTHRKTKTGSLVAETDSATRLARIAGQGKEVDSATSTAHAKNKLSGQVTETDSALTIIPIKHYLVIAGQAVENDSAPRLLLIAKSANETETAQPVLRTLLTAVNVSTETDIAI
ncbi:MAG TPA: hypothetical protein V6C65_08015, partial [Allocoleopsis sp.]